jgi:hypothetical protein
MANESEILTVGELREFLDKHNVADDALIGVEIAPGGYDPDVPDVHDVATAGFEIISNGFQRLTLRNKQD